MVLIAGVAAFSFALVPAVAVLLRRAGVVDVPNDRSSHQLATPRGGGVAVILAMVTGLSLSSGSHGHTESAIVVGAIALGAVGLCDDVKGLDARLRLVLQICTATVGAMVAARSFDHHWAAIAAGALLFVGFTNAFNFMDGINAISALFAIWSGVWIAILSGLGAPEWLHTYGLALAAASTGFLPWNLSGRVFLGDVGSYFIGFAIAGGVFVAVLGGAGWIESLAVLAIYCADTAWALLKRLRRRRSWRTAHREHVYQRLVDAGFGHTVVAMVALAAVVACSLISIAPWSMPCRIGLVALTCSCYLCLPRLSIHVRGAPH